MEEVDKNDNIVEMDKIKEIYEAYNRGVSDGREDFELIFKRNGQLLQTLKKYENEIEQLKTQLQQANAGIVNCSGCYLVETNAAQTCAEKIFKEIYKRASKNTFFDAWVGLNLEELAKQFGVEIDKISKDNEE